MQDWLKRHLIAGGHLTESGLVRAAKLRRCRDCGSHVLAGLDAELCALEVNADPTPLSPLGEALALLEGRRTVAVHREGRGFVLDDRCRTSITAKPAGTQRREDVVREHRCGPDLTDALTAPTSFVEAAPKSARGSLPPF